MEKIVEQGLLYDFYGELLTKHQQSVYEDVVFNDLSLSEIADEQGMERYRWCYRVHQRGKTDPDDSCRTVWP